MEDLGPATFVATFRDEKKDYHVGLTKSAGLIKELVNKNLHLFLNNKSAVEMWTFLENRFQYILPMSVTRFFCETCNVKLSDCKDVIDYTGRYQVAFDKIQSLIGPNSWMSKKTAEIALQGSLLRHLGKDYSALVSAIKMVWEDGNINLNDIIFRVTRHAKINRGNTEDNEDTSNTKVLAANIQQAPKGTCITKEYVERGVTIHYTDQCWIPHPELRAKYSLCQMQTRGLNQNLRKANTPAENTEIKRETTSIPEINC